MLFLLHPSHFSQTLRHLPEVAISESDPKWGGVGPCLGLSSPSLRQGSPYSHVPESFFSPSSEERDPCETAASSCLPRRSYKHRADGFISCDVREGCSVAVRQCRALPSPPGRPFSLGLLSSISVLNICFLSGYKDHCQPFNTHTLECRNPHSTWSVHRAFLTARRPPYCSQLWEPLVRGTPESQLLSFQITSRFFLSKSPSSFPNHRHWLLPKFHAP